MTGYRQILTGCYVCTALFLILSLAAGCSGSTAQDSPSADTYVQTWGGVGDIYTENLTTNDDGDIYVIGQVGYHPPGAASLLLPSNTLNIIREEETIPMYLSKFDSSGAPIWTIAWNATEGWLSDPEVECDSLGNIYIAGIIYSSYMNPIDLDPGPAKNFFYDDYRAFFLMKLNPAGMFVWAHTWGEISGTIPPIELAISDSDRIRVLSRWDDAINYDPGTGNITRISSGYSGSSQNQYNKTLATSPPWPNTEDFFLMEFNRDGDPELIRTWGSNKPGYMSGLEIDQMGNSIVCGSFQDTVDFGPSQDESVFTSNGFSDAYVSSVNKSGICNWTITFGGEGFDTAVDVAVDRDGMIYVTGYFSLVIDFDPGPGAATHVAADPDGRYDMFLCKYGPDGSYIWSRSWAVGDQYLYPRELVITDNTLFLLGRTGGSIDFDPGEGVDLRTITDSPNCVIKLNSDGNYLGMRTWRLGDYEDCMGMVPGSDTGFWVTGYYDEVYPTSSGIASITKSYLCWFSNDPESWH